MKLNGLAARVGRLEEASGDAELPNGGMVLTAMGEGETRDQAIERWFNTPAAKSLSTSQRRKVIVVALDKTDLDL